MTLQQLEYIVAVAEHRHFLKAAEACDVTQPTLSSMVQKLEEELGIKIFDRKQKPIVPTEVGEIVIAQARQMLAQAQQLRESVEEECNTLAGTFHVGYCRPLRPTLFRASSPISVVLSPSWISALPK